MRRWCLHGKYLVYWRCYVPLIAVQVRHVDGACNGQLIITAGILGVVSCWRLDNTAQVCVVFAICL